MDSTVDAMAAAYKALVDAAAAVALREPDREAALRELQRCLHAFNESCDRAEDLVRAAAATLDFAPAAATALDALGNTVRGIEQDAQAGPDDGDEEEVQDGKGPAPSPPAAPVALAADDN
ncbi:hypothetical protein CFC21_067662 [Triticum aestivum]|uniref:Uncharacterized protein n=2 Tax=Triticum aestivum TaxID=4565 RepID=A0A9R1H7W6_WHEAT|nr:hypothetical protein CFC21_067659 [Triticum aestivum]KAF7060922.1 hypothetical protein CFC21_067662 [Triticum aestivum]